jgi:predicted nucleic acid-binding protein
MTSPIEAATEIVARGGPVVFVDTCSIVDLTREPRDNFHPDHAETAMRLIQLSDSEKITIALSEQVLNEFPIVYEVEKKKAVAALKQLNKQMSNLHGNLRAYGHSVPAFTEIPEDFFAAACDDVSEKFRATSISFDATADAKLKAAQRVLEHKAPSGKKQSFKDCLIIESCFETLAAARGLGFSATAYFLTRNDEDYGKLGLHLDLATEFLALSLEYVSTFAEFRSKPSIRDL